LAAATLIGVMQDRIASPSLCTVLHCVCADKGVAATKACSCQPQKVTHVPKGQVRNTIEAAVDPIPFEPDHPLLASDSILRATLPGTHLM
jgi:hypothetical protein